MKNTSTTVLLICMLLLCACQPGTPAPDYAAASQPSVSPATALEIPLPENDSVLPLLKTSMGEFEIVSARFVDEVNGATPNEGEKILLIGLSLPGGEPLDPATFSLEAFNTMSHDTSQGEIHLRGDDGSMAISSMGGWVNGEFVMGFRVPEAVKTFTLEWPGNPPILVSPE